MAWNNNRNNGYGYGNNNGYRNNYGSGYGRNPQNGRRPNGRNNNWGNGYDNYDRYEDDQQDRMPRPFDINQPVRHIATGIRLIVIKYGREQVECRKPDLTSDYFYLYELEPINDDEQN